MGCLNDAPGSGNEHKTISFAKALKENGNFEVFYYDNDISKSTKAIELWGGKYFNLNTVDVVIIATPDNTHYDILKWEWLGNPKVVIVEKPLCSTVEEVKEIVKLYEEAGIPILVDYTRRFIPEYQELIGKVGAITCNYNRGKLHTLTHALDLLTMYGIDDYVDGDFGEYSADSVRRWELTLYDKKGNSIFTEKRIGDEPVHSRFDYHTRYVIDNAYNFLEGKEELRCNMYDGLKTLEIMERLCE